LNIFKEVKVVAEKGTERINILLILKDAVIDLYNHIGYTMLISVLWFFTTLFPLMCALDLMYKVYQTSGEAPYGLFFLLLLCAVPYGALIVGPVHTALLYQMSQVIANEAEFKGLWLGLRKFYWKSVGIYALYMLTLLFTLFDVFICFFLAEHIFIKFIGFFLLYLFLFLLLASIYLPGFIVFQNNTWKKVYKKTIVLTLDNTLTTLGIQLILLALGIGCTVVTPLLIFFYGGYLQITGVRLFHGLMRKYPDPVAADATMSAGE
jgi:hypothetical protein